MHECQFFPDLGFAMEIFEARRIANAWESARGAASGTPRTNRPHRARRGGDEVEWASEPLVVGLAMTLLPPLGATLLWSSRRFSETAKLMLTVYAGFMTVVVAALLVVIARG
jgi:hypothetical protein